MACVHLADRSQSSTTGAPGVAADLSHINTPSIAEGFGPENDGLAKALKGSEVRTFAGSARSSLAD